ncbi:MAG: hypothetical protein FWD47_14255 [Treponema sp.]|nr:hypothetical protein [Treponema sp.]
MIINNSIFPENERLFKIAYRMDSVFHDSIVNNSEVNNNIDGRMVPINLLATHHCNKDGGFRCRLPLTFTKNGTLIPKTGNFYARKTMRTECELQLCKHKCDAVLQFTKYCLDGDISSFESSCYGFLIFINEATKDYSNFKSVYNDVIAKSLSDLAASILHLYGYIDNDEYIAFPVRAETDFDNLVIDLEAHMKIISKENGVIDPQAYEDKMFDRVKKAFKHTGHVSWKRSQWLFCKTLIYLSTVSLNDNDFLYQKAKSTWINGFGMTPEEWMQKNGKTVA